MKNDEIVGNTTNLPKNGDTLVSSSNAGTQPKGCNNHA